VAIFERAAVGVKAVREGEKEMERVDGMVGHGG